jgi:uncharacterized membrane protein YfcA
VVIGLIAPLMNLSDPMALRYYWRQWDARQLRLLLPTAIAGIVAGGWALSRLSEPGLRRAIALFALAFAGVQLVLVLRGRTLFRGRPHWTVGAVAGGVTGVAATVAHSGGVVAGLYLLGLGLSTASVVATGNALYAVTNVVKTLTYWQIGFLTGPILLASVLATPFLFAGVRLGYRANRAMPRRWFELALIGIAVAGSLRLLTMS